ncbi:hypothetical protein FHU39_001871 [Flexivirga oryzae]|uniref:Uncharacterized protein n=1 Tax=Flexivirga oryzae TaxID=1794944 RepID=A0A839N3J8_9MICO|nr:hypothetical protein [Flexivirga oryzae]
MKFGGIYWVCLGGRNWVQEISSVTAPTVRMHTVRDLQLDEVSQEPEDES